MTSGPAALAQAITGVVATRASLVAAIRTGTNRHVSGIHWRPDTIIAADQSLPVQDRYNLTMAGGTMAAGRPGPRDPALSLAAIRLDTPITAGGAEPAGDPPIGTPVILLGAGFDGTPTARLGLVHARGRDGALTLDLRIEDTETGGAVITLSGQLLGLAISLPAGRTGLVGTAAIARLTDAMPSAHPGSRTTQPPSGRRGWLGVSLQPITVPEALVARAGQTSGRMVVNLTPGGPAEDAGLRVGDVLLALNGHSASGSHALRAFLGADRIGTQIEVRLLRDGTVLTTYLTVAEQPG